MTKGLRIAQRLFTLVAVKRLRFVVLAASAASPMLLACGVAMRPGEASTSPHSGDGYNTTLTDAGNSADAAGNTSGSGNASGNANGGGGGSGSTTGAARGATGAGLSGNAGANGGNAGGAGSSGNSSASGNASASGGAGGASGTNIADAGSSDTGASRQVIVERANMGFAPGTQYSLSPGSYLVALDTPARTYLDYIQVPASGTWTLPTNGTQMAAWEGQTKILGVRFVAFTPGDALSASAIQAMLPESAISARTIDITAPPYSSPTNPADATTNIRSALDAAAALATAQQPVDVLVPPGQFNFSSSLSVGSHVRLRGAGGVLMATTPDNAAVHLVGDGSAALFLKLVSPASVRGSTLGAGILVGINQNTPVNDTRVIGNEVVQSEGMQVVAMNEVDGLWAFNYVHGGFADGFHHTYRSKYDQVVANRAMGTGDDFYAFVGYGADGDPVHHCTCIANWGQGGKARGLSAVGAGYIDFENNDVSQTQAAGIYLARESSYDTFGTFSVTVHGNRVSKANLSSTHGGLLAFADDPTLSKPTVTFGQLPNIVRDLTIAGNSFTAISQGQGGQSDGYGVEVRQSCDGGTVTNNTVSNATAPGFVVNGNGYVVSGNTFTP